MEPLGDADAIYLRRYGLTLDQASCKEFRSDVDQFTTCPLMRQTAPDSEAAPQGK
jgi:hypothetical protein